MFYKNNLSYLLLILLFSCQPVELIAPVEFDYSKFDTISINAKEISVNIKYDSIFSEDNIEDQVSTTPLTIIENWINENINYYGNQNQLVINIVDASITKKEIENIDAKKYQEKTIYLYEVFFLVEYELLDDNDYFLANTTVQSTRSTTSQKYISLNEKEVIINDLLNKALKDFIIETKLMTKQYMGEYL